jgi:Cys-tRNA(Pro)/Cys-tRNA(Cys) deacylase
MGKTKDEKTNVMRILDKAGIAYRQYVYDHEDGKIDGLAVAAKLGQNVEQVFKTLVTKGSSGAYFVFVIPVAKELDLKAAARSVGEKAVEMIHVADINRVTGYIRGGCSPIGMKKQYRTVIDDSCLQQETIIFSGGKIGTQVEMDPRQLLSFTGASAQPVVQG